MTGRYRWVLAHDQPELAGYDQDLWVDALHRDDEDPDDLLRQFEALRAANLAAVARVRPRRIARAWGSTASAARRASTSCSACSPATTGSISPRPVEPSTRFGADRAGRAGKDSPGLAYLPRCAACVPLVAVALLVAFGGRRARHDADRRRRRAGCSGFRPTSRPSKRRSTRQRPAT